MVTVTNQNLCKDDQKWSVDAGPQYMFRAKTLAFSRMPSIKVANHCTEDKRLWEIVGEDHFQHRVPTWRRMSTWAKGEGQINIVQKWLSLSASEKTQIPINDHTVRAESSDVSVLQVLLMLGMTDLDQSRRNSTKLGNFLSQWIVSHLHTHVCMSTAFYAWHKGTFETSF